MPTVKLPVVCMLVSWDEISLYDMAEQRTNEGQRQRSLLKEPSKQNSSWLSEPLQMEVESNAGWHNVQVQGMARDIGGDKRASTIEWQTSEYLKIIQMRWEHVDTENRHPGADRMTSRWDLEVSKMSCDTLHVFLYFYLQNINLTDAASNSLWMARQALTMTWSLSLNECAWSLSIPRFLWRLGSRFTSIMLMKTLFLSID